MFKTFNVYFDETWCVLILLKNIVPSLHAHSKFSNNVIMF